METARLGHTPYRVSRFILGCGSFGGLGSDPRFFGMGEAETDAFALMGAAWDAGINCLDTADAYGGGRSDMGECVNPPGKGSHAGSAPIAQTL